MSAGRCPLHSDGGRGEACLPRTRRAFLKESTAVLAGTSFLAGCSVGANNHSPVQRSIRQCGPASRYRPALWAALVRRQGDYGMLWPGAVYDGDVAMIASSPPRDDS